VVDHCHTSLMVRGALCNLCNTALHGVERHGIPWLVRCARYLNGRCFGQYSRVDWEHIAATRGSLRLPDDRICVPHLPQVPDNESPCYCQECESARVTPLSPYHPDHPTSDD
jgi:hypothetical protein